MGNHPVLWVLSLPLNHLLPYLYIFFVSVFSYKANEATAAGIFSLRGVLCDMLP